MQENRTQEKEKNNKKKHLVIEVVLVIIILLLLIGIVVPTTMLLSVNKGVSQDAELIKNLNTALKVDKDTTHKEHRNMTEALNAAASAGYDVSRINATKTNNEILWDSKNDAFVYYNNDKNDVEYLSGSVEEANQLSVKKAEDVYYLWKICTAKPSLNYSMYWVGAEADIPNTLTAGFDAGVKEVKRELTYKTTFDFAQNVVIRSNSKECVINIEAPLDTVTHYGNAKTVNVIKVANHSYVERGTTHLISMNEGRAVLTEEAEVAGFYFEAHDTNNDGKNDTFNEIVVKLDEGVELPTFYRDPVEIDPEGTLVCKVETNTDEYIWLAKEGIYEQIKVSETTGSDKVWVSTSDATEDTKQISQDIANILDYGATVNEETRDIIPEEGKTVEESVEETGKTQEEAQDIVDIKVNVKAYTESYIPSTNDLAMLYYNQDYTDKAAVDVAYRFNAFNEDEKVYINAFLSAKDNGKPIFTNNINDYSNEAKIARALEVLEQEMGANAKEVVSGLLETRRPYFNYLADYEVSFDRDIDVGSVALLGYYESFASVYSNNEWIGFGVADVVGEEMLPLKANKTVRLLDTAYNVTHISDFHMNYAAICGYVKEFLCGFANLSEANAGATITVTLNIYEVDGMGNETGKKIECGRYTATLGAVSEVNKQFLKK